jgi:hypothetical protein
MKKMKARINFALGWIGAAMMVIAAFISEQQAGAVDPLLSIIGLILLSIQAHEKKMNNLLLLNSLSIIGYLTVIVENYI